MPACPHCGVELDGSTLEPSDLLTCDKCGGSLPPGDESAGLSSVAGSPADMTIDLGKSSESGLSLSSLADSEDGLTDSSADSAPADMTLDSGGASSGADDLFEATIALGGKARTPDSLADFDDFDFDDEDAPEVLEDEPSGEPSTSLDSTIDVCQWAKDEGLEADDFDRAYEATMDLAGRPQHSLLDPPEPEDPPSHADATMAFDSSSASSDSVDEESHDSRFEATLAVDSDQPSSMSESDVGSADLTDEPTLAFDSERRSSGVDTPEALDITGLASDGTMPRGPLGDERASGSLRPGDSQLVGEESVRLRAFELADAVGKDPLTIDYAIEGEAGKGGMGIVYLATQQSLKRPVAIKQIKSDLGARPSDLNKFVSEAVITGQLEHPNIAPVHDLGLAADGLPFYAMKFVEGEDWEDAIKDKSEEENLGILIQVAQAIAFAHSKEVLHRDLKPGNIRLGSFGEVLVMDWGLAARLDGSEIQPAGTPIYMPPETALEYLDHARGKVIGGKRVESTRRRVPAGVYCDIYLLGALLFKIVTGRAPHRGKTTFDCLRNAARNEIVKTRRKSELLDIAYKAMATEPEDRYTTASEFVDAIKAYQSHAQSIQIAKRASKDLREAGRLLDEKEGKATELYALFSRAQNGYQNALDLWDGNRKAKRRLKRTKRMFAESAYAGGDFELALSLLDDDVDEAEDLRVSVASAQKSRKTRLAWFKRLQYATAVSLMLALAFIGYSVVAKLDAISANAEKTRALADADLARSQARETKNQADELVAAAEATAAKRISEAEDKAAKKIKQGDFEAARKVAAADKKAAEKVAAANQQAQLKIDKADEQVLEATREAKAQAYFADLGRVRATLLDRGAYAALKEMNKVDPEVVAAANDPAWRMLAQRVRKQSQATELVGEQPGGGERPTRLARSGDGQWVVAVANAGPDNSTLTFYRANQPGQPARTLRVDAGVGPLSIDATGRFVAIAGANLVVVDSQTGRVIPTPGGSSPSTSVAFHPTEPELLVGREDTSVERWSLSETGAKLLDPDDRWHQSRITAVGYSPDGAQRVSADESGRIVAWRLANGKWTERVSFLHEGGGSGRVTALSVADDRGGRIAVGCDDGSVYELLGWFGEELPLKPSGAYAEVVSERLASRHAGAVTSIAYAEEGKTILSAGGDTLLVQGAPVVGPPKATRRVERRYHDTTVLACLPNGAGRAYSADAHGRVIVWDLDAEADQIAYQTRPGAQRGAGVAAMRLASANGRDSLIVADRNGFARRWEDLRQPAQAELRFVGHADHRAFRAWRLGGDDPRIVTVAADNRAVVWRESDGLPERPIDLGGRTVVAVDEKRGLLLAASDGREITDGPQAVAISLRDGKRQPMWDDLVRVARITPLQGAEPGAPSVAVGLRDGQVYLWGPDTGRTELTISSGRAHWRPIVNLTHDREGNRLLSADRGGLIAAWDLSGGGFTETRLTGTEPVTRLIPWRDQQILVIRGAEKGVLATAFTRRLEPMATPPFATPGLIDIASDGRGGLSGIASSRGQTRLLSWSPTGWATDATTSLRATGLAATQEGRLLWGPGTAQWWGGQGSNAVASKRLVSRTPAASVVDSGARGAIVLSQAGATSSWGESGDVSRLAIDGRLVASSEGPEPGHALLAIAGQSGQTRLEGWDLAAGRKLRDLAKPLTGRVLAISPLGKTGGVAALESSLVFVSPDQPSQAVRLPGGIEGPQSVVANPAGDTVAVVTIGGDLLIAERGRDGTWEVHPTDRKQVDSAAFTSVGDRLLIGAAGGRVEMLGVAELRGGVYATRRLLSLTGHGDRITHLKVEPTDDGGATLLSGDASGLVLARPL